MNSVLKLQKLNSENDFFNYDKKASLVVPSYSSRIITWSALSNYCKKK
ncbi:class III lanthipeptide [Mammaliicoccus sciuri]